jgi:hypothetical protein
MLEKNMSLYEPDLSASLKMEISARTEGLCVVICLGIITTEDIDVFHNCINVNIATSPVCTWRYM